MVFTIFKINILFGVEKMAW